MLNDATPNCTYVQQTQVNYYSLFEKGLLTLYLTYIPDTYRDTFKYKIVINT